MVKILKNEQANREFFYRIFKITYIFKILFAFIILFLFYLFLLVCLIFISNCN